MELERAHGFGGQKGDLEGALAVQEEGRIHKGVSNSDSFILWIKNIVQRLFQLAHIKMKLFFHKQTKE